MENQPTPSRILSDDMQETEDAFKEMGFHLNLRCTETTRTAVQRLQEAYGQSLEGILEPKRRCAFLNLLKKCWCSPSTSTSALGGKSFDWASFACLWRGLSATQLCWCLVTGTPRVRAWCVNCRSWVCLAIRSIELKWRMIFQLATWTTPGTEVVCVFWWHGLCSVLW